MIAWIDANKSWLFEGAGVALVSGLIGLGVFLYRREKPAPPRAPLPSSSPLPGTRVDSEPALFATALDAIAQEMRESPPLARDEVGRRFEGLQIRWELQLRSILPMNDGRVVLRMDTDSFDGEFAECTVTLTDYPQLKSMKRKTRIIVYGRISKAESHRVTLEDVRLEFPTTPTRSEQALS